MRRLESASPEIPFPLLDNPRDVLLSMAPLLMAGAASLFFLLLLILLLLLLLYRPWRFFFTSTQTDEISRPLLSDNLDGFSGWRNGPSSSIDEQRQVIQIDDNGSSIINHSFVSRKQSYSLQPAVIQEENTLPDYENNVHEVRNTLKRNAVTSWRAPDSKHLKHHSIDFNRPFKDAKLQQVSTLSLEATSGPSSGLHMSITSDTCPAELTIGRVAPNSLILNDSEVSGRHAVVKFNDETQKWEITDLGSLNGTYLNSISIRHPDKDSRNYGAATALSSGDVIIFGTSSKLSVGISQVSLANLPSGRVRGKPLNEILQDLKPRCPGIGMASYPMARRRGGKALPMEDVGLLQYPLLGVEKFGLVGVFDGHAGSKAAQTASRVFPQNVVKILSQSGEKERVLSNSDASGTLQQAFAMTEDQMKHHEYEGCTATTLLIWSGSDGDLFAQCANLGDSECVIYIDGLQVVMTEVHKVISAGERDRIAKTGQPLKDGESRIAGLNLSRTLGDSFVKAQDPRLISEPYVSKVVHVTKESSAFALVASDGLWDVLRPAQAINFVVKIKERFKGQQNYAELIAEAVVKEAAEKRTSDNTTVVFIDFDDLRTHSSSTL